MRGVDPTGALARLEALRTAGRPLSDAVAMAASALEVSPRSVWRWMAAEPTVRGTRRWQPSSEDIGAYVRWKGNAAQAWRQRSADGADLPGIRTFQRGIAEQLTSADRAVVAEGAAARRRYQVYLQWEPEGRNHLWEADHKQLNVEVTYPRCSRPVKPWVTTFIDGFSRAIMGWAIDRRASSGTVLAALGQAIRADARQGPFCGIPLTIRPDRGSEFLATALRRCCAELGIELLPTRAYSPHLKGKVERLHRTYITAFLAELPHFTGGPRDAAGRLWGDGLPLLGFDDLVGRFSDWVTDYNLNRTHQGIDRDTPLERWNEDANPIRRLDDRSLDFLLLADKPRTVRKWGIRYNNHHYIAPELDGLVGESLEIRYRPHDETSIEVFRNGVHLCTAWPQDRLSAEQTDTVLLQRQANSAELAKRQRKATRLARRRFSPATSSTGAQDITVVSAGQLMPDEMRSRNHDPRRIARTDLLDLPSQES